MDDDPRLAVMQAAYDTWRDNRKTYAFYTADMFQILLAALDAHAAVPAPEGTARRHILVWTSADGDADCRMLRADEDGHAVVRQYTAHGTQPMQFSIITADVPLPKVAEVPGRVEK